MGLIVVGLNHRSAPLDVRERAFYRPGGTEIAEAFERLTAGGVREVVGLSTCNRTEFYVVEGETDAAPDTWSILSERIGADASALGYVRRDRDAAAHLFRVASGLDSMVVGEAQIHGQVRDAWERSRPKSGALLNRLFQTSLLVAGRVRSETSVAHGAASVSSAAVQLSKQIFGSLAGRRAMVLGAGEMAELALECLRNEGVQAAVVANRTYERAEELAARYGAAALHFDACWDALADVDLLLCSTAAPHAIVGPAQIRPTLAARRGRPLCILDIAMPRDVEPAVAGLDNVFLYDLDALQAVIAATMERRRNELPSAEQVIGEEVERYWAWMASLVAVPVVTAFRSRMDALRARELEAALKRLPSLSETDRAQIEQLSISMMNKFLHEPTVRLRAAAANGRGLGIVDAARYLFALDQEPSPASDPSHSEES